MISHELKFIHIFIHIPKHQVIPFRIFYKNILQIKF